MEEQKEKKQLNKENTKQIKKKRRKKKKKRTVLGIIGHILLILLLLFIIGIFVAFFAANYIYESKTGTTIKASYEAAEEIVSTASTDDFKLKGKTKIYASDGTCIATLNQGASGTYLEYDEIPSNIVNAFIAIEDKTFWENPGFDIKANIRILKNYIVSDGEDVTGASTVTQQLVKNVYLSSEKTLERKLKEIIISYELTKLFSKEDIMEGYCNICCFGNNIYGINDASLKYFGVTPDKLTLSQAAYLCAIPNRPSYYDPWKDQTTALSRRDKILKKMLEYGFITQAQYNDAINETITVLDKTQASATDVIQYNYETSYAIFCATECIMKHDGFNFKYSFTSNEDYEDYQELYEDAYSEANTKLYYDEYKIETSLDLAVQEQAQETLNNALSKNTAVLDSGEYKLQGAATIIDNDSHKVIAVIGGRTNGEPVTTYTLNRAFQGYAQPGSSIKPLVVYTPSFEAPYNYNKYSNLRNINVSDAKTASKKEEIDELANCASEMQLRNAVWKSVNGCAEWLYAQTDKIGFYKLSRLKFAKITPDDSGYATALGGLTYGTTTEEMAGAYSALANEGVFYAPTCIVSLKDASGNELFHEESEQVYSRYAAENMTDILTGVLKYGTAASSRWYSTHSNITAAGKTGTTNDNKAGWFCGYTPYYTVTVWVGCDKPTSVNGLTGSSYPLTIWNNIMSDLVRDKEARAFDTYWVEPDAENEEQAQEVAALEDEAAKAAEEQMIIDAQNEANIVINNYESLPSQTEQNATIQNENEQNENESGNENKDETVTLIIDNAVPENTEEQTQ